MKNKHQKNGELTGSPRRSERLPVRWNWPSNVSAGSEQISA
jgi:hypothetical protein